MNRYPKKNAVRDTVSLAGWVFADLLLALAMIFLVVNSKVSSQGQAAPTPTWTATATRTATPTATVTPTPTATRTPEPTPTRLRTRWATLKAPTIKAPTQQIGLDPSAVICSFTVPVDGLSTNDSGALNEIRRQLETCYGKEKGKRIAGMAVTLGYSRNPVGTGFRTAERVNEILKEAMPEVFGQTVMKAFGWYSSADEQQDVVNIEAYFVASLQAK